MAMNRLLLTITFILMSIGCSGCLTTSGQQSAGATTRDSTEKAYREAAVREYMTYIIDRRTKLAFAVYTGNPRGSATMVLVPYENVPAGLAIVIKK